MSKVTDIIVNLMLKKGVLGDFRNFETKIDVPQESGKITTIIIKADHLQVRMENKNEEG